MSLLSNAMAIPQIGGYNLTDSLRFRGSAGAYLSRTPTTAGNRKTWTYSAWVKLGNMSTTRMLFLGGTADASSTRGTSCYIYPSTSGTAPYQLALGSFGIGTNRSAILFRDPSAWYHIVLSIDTTQATAANRTRLYVNGIENFFDIQYFAQNVDTGINSTTQHEINGNYGVGVGDGYITEVNFVDGQALTPSDFGEYDAITSVWKPKQYAGTYGTNGFYLPMNGSKESYTVDYLVIAGGGGGGGTMNNGFPGGGGGAGGYRTGIVYPTIGQSYTITVGAGGAGGAAGGKNNGTQGQNTLISGAGITTITSIGGGYGGGGDNSTGNAGGSGGSGGGAATLQSGGTGTTGQGNNGGTGNESAPNYASGGGGGASATGAAGTSTAGGNGGNGLASSITGASVTRAGGGGGGSFDGGTAGSGGTGGGGAGKASNGNGISGTVNTGGGGGGAGARSTAGGAGGSGGSGIVILRMPTASYTGTTTGSPTVTTDGTDTILTYTSSGTYTA